MHRAIDTIYENGTFPPVHREVLALTEGQRVQITVDDGVPEVLRQAIAVYDGLSHQDMDEIEKITLDRSSFFGSKR